ncbi:UDP-N-acetylmuramoyl-L-alanyl-D-glutamate--2,6-diaminopimelate ligase [Actinoallomurus sp. CA-150999]|uniref:UDP-N-acetylmuramoyl-L-alanyl-D-glutamate--2, 6-diaminopimelate ligase n=1 Tax=Actinoallomurus sp. CA-150999 TaxID=3239887 RepID=UPI003D92174B
MPASGGPRTLRAAAVRGRTDPFGGSASAICHQVPQPRSVPMRLSDLAMHVPDAVLNTGGGDYDVRRVVHDSRHARPGDLFVAVRGLRADGHDYVSCLAREGIAVAVERTVPLPAGAPVLRLPDTRTGLAELAAVLHGRPARELLVTGVTGTAGKTTTTHMTAHILTAAGTPAGYLSTVAHGTGSSAKDNRSGQTTMAAPDNQAWLARMVARRMRAAVVETSSHALEQGRVAACDFDVAAYTNIGADHLDYHGTWENYFLAKTRLMELTARAVDKGVPKTTVINRDDPSWEALSAHCLTERRLTYGIEHPADVRATNVSVGRSDVRFVMRTFAGSAHVRLELPALFNVRNALCAAASCLALGVPVEAVADALARFEGVRGRLQRVDQGQPFDVYIDFAHSSLRLRTVLGELRSKTPGRLIAVFGTTGRADHDPAGMGRAAAQHADFFIITTDDPAGEDPGDLAEQVESGVKGRRRGTDYEVILDRRTAIWRAVEMAQPGDVVILAGKGPERTMLLADGPVPWDERAEVETALRELGRAIA